MTWRYFFTQKMLIFEAYKHLNMKRLLTVALLAATLALPALAQEMNSLMFRAPVKSPELTESTLTFRYRAP